MCACNLDLVPDVSLLVLVYCPCVGLCSCSSCAVGPRVARPGGDLCVTDVLDHRGTRGHQEWRTRHQGLL